jgi:hypothetical protein
MTARDQLVGDGAGAIARDREADAGSAAADLRIGRGQRRNADDLTFEVDERPLLPGLIAALVWITSGRLFPVGSETCRLKALTMPSVTLD